MYRNGIMLQASNILACLQTNGVYKRSATDARWLCKLAPHLFDRNIPTNKFIKIMMVL